MDVRPADRGDLDAIRAIYNEGIAVRVATLEAEPRDEATMAGWASINPYNQRCAYAGVGEV